jgi:hypothetical protein
MSSEPSVFSDESLRIAGFIPTSPDATEQRTYEIKWHRPARVGDAWAVHFEREVGVIADVKSSNPADATHLQQQLDHFELTGKLEVTRVDERAYQTAVVLTIKKFTGPDGRDLVASGKSIEVITTGGDLKCTLRGGGSIAGDAVDAIKDMFWAGNTGGEKADTLYGSPSPLSVGETWPVNAAAVAADMKQPSMQVQAKDVSGLTTLQGLGQMNGTPLMLLENATTAQLHIDGVPFGFKVDRAEMKTSMKSLLPLDLTRPPLESEKNEDIRISLSGSVLFTPVSMEMTTHLRQTLTPIIPRTED